MDDLDNPTRITFRNVAFERIKLKICPRARLFRFVDESLRCGVSLASVRPEGSFLPVLFVRGSVLA
jgi:hypothetical protein